MLDSVLSGPIHVESQSAEVTPVSQGLSGAWAPCHLGIVPLGRRAAVGTAHTAVMRSWPHRVANLTWAPAVQQPGPPSVGQLFLPAQLGQLPLLFG